MTHVSLPDIDPADLTKLTDDQLKDAVSRIVQLQESDRQDTAILYYRPVSDRAKRIHLSNARVIAVGGGNGSSKTETCLAHLVALATGVIPENDPEISAALKAQFRGPVAVRIVVESLTTVLHPIILKKLQWWHWTGVGEPGGEKGHWGWVPKTSLVGGSWDKSWSEKLRILTVVCRDPEQPERVLGQSTFQFMSHDQDASDFASGDFHHVMHDEPPTLPIWRENEARTMRINGRMWLAMTWPDDPSIPVDWIFDEVYERGCGPNKRDDVDWFDLHTIDNMHLNQDAIAAQMAKWSVEMQKVRIYGQPIRFSNRVHPLFTDLHDTWCFTCNKTCVPAGDTCNCERQSEKIVPFCHVTEFDAQPNWPVVMIIDPHPRKPHMMIWVAVDPADDYHVIAEAECTGDAVDVRELAFALEEQMGLDVRLRLMDPNMGRTPLQKREITWQDEFDAAGLRCDLGDDSAVGRKRIDQYLRPDESTHRPRLDVHIRCTKVVHQIKRYVWDDFKRNIDKDQKQLPKEKNDDYATMLKYLMNYLPTFRFLKTDRGVISIVPPGERLY